MMMMMMMIIAVTGKRVKLQCPCSSCGKSFCSLCREIYHYNIDCDELKDVKIQWIQWNTQDRSGINKQLEDLAMQHRKADIAKVDFCFKRWFLIITK
jgi:hypothetical protein